MPRAVFQDESIVALLADLHGMRKALVDGTDIREAAAGRNDGERSTGPSAKEEQASMLSRGLIALLRVGVDVVEDGAFRDARRQSCD